MQILHILAGEPEISELHAMQLFPFRKQFKLRTAERKKMTINKITESSVEQFAIELLEKSGYQYVYGPDIAPDRDVQVSRVQDAQERPPDSETKRNILNG